MNPFTKKEPDYLEKIQKYYRSLWEAKMSHDEIYLDDHGKIWTHKSWIKSCQDKLTYMTIEELTTGLTLYFHEHKGEIHCYPEKEFLKLEALVRRGYDPFNYPY